MTLLKSFSPLTALHVGNTFASTGYPSVTGIVPSEPDLNYLSDLGLKARLPVWRQAWQSEKLTFPVK